MESGLPIFSPSFPSWNLLEGSAVHDYRAITFYGRAFSPTADPLSMAALAVPLIVLYFGSGGIGLLVDKRRDRKSRSVADDEAAPIGEVAPIEEPTPEA